MTQPTLYLMMGLPGAGKTTAAEIIEDLTGAIHLSSDDARLMLWEEPDFSEEEHQALYEYLDDQTKHLLQAGKSVVYDANLNRRVHREQKYELARELGAEVKLCWVKTLRETAKERRIDDVEHHRLVTKHEDPATMFERIAHLLEEPGTNEPHIELDGTKITSKYVATQLHTDQ